MPDYFSYSEIWKMAQDEKKTNILLPVPKDFYKSVIKTINEEIKNDLEKANATKTILDMFERRKQKILVYVAYNKPLPNSVDDTELSFYETIKKEAKAEKLNISKDDHNKVVLKVCKDIPEIILPSGNKIGPLTKDKIIEVESIDEDAIFLLNNSICEKI
ncbi:MAG: hypothetical protein ACP5TL_01975 [Candidatus Micrarchaeia archaeon]